MPASRQTGFQERSIEQLSRIVAEKGAPGAVCAFEARRQSHDQEARVGKPERGDCAIEPIRMRKPVLFTVGDKPRAKGAVTEGFGWVRMRHGA